MAAADPSLVNDVFNRLQNLLQRASEIKPTNDIEPPLPSAAFAGDLGLPPDDGNAKSHSTVVEIAARRIFEKQAASTNNLDADFIGIWNLLDVLNILGDQDQCEPTLLWYIVEELLDSRSIEGCRVIFDYLESRRERLVVKHFKKIFLIILRACNELLRRLSRAEDAVFCGRVLIFVFQSFPLGDKSSVNRQGEYNTDNVTTFDKLQAGQVEGRQSEDLIMVDADTTTFTATETIKNPDLTSFDELHPKFWDLQKTFAYPPTIFDPNLLAEFKVAFSATLAKFNSAPKVFSAPASSKQSLKRKAETIGRDESGNNFNPKYLTSRELFELELSDLSFQRHILVQAMILLEFLLSFTEKAKKKLHARTQQKYQFTLSEEDTEWVAQTKKAIVAALREGQDGPAFVRMVETVLSRDKNWVRWKEINCPEISIAGVGPDEYSSATSGARTLCAWKKIRRTPMGSLDLQFLSESEHNLEVDMLTDSERYTLPDTKAMISKVAIIDLDLEMATDEEAIILNQQKASNTWKALRIASADRLNRFNELQLGKPLDVLLEKTDQEQVHQVDETTKSSGTSEVVDEDVQENQTMQSIDTASDLVAKAVVKAAVEFPVAETMHEQVFSTNDGQTSSTT